MVDIAELTAHRQRVRSNRWINLPFCLVLLALSCSACRAAEPRIPALDAADGSPKPASAAQIGTATMLSDGTILLQLRAEAPGALGDAQLRYRPGDPNYPAVRDHLPTLRVGGTVAVPPFE